MGPLNQPDLRNYRCILLARAKVRVGDIFLRQDTAIRFAFHFEKFAELPFRAIYVNVLGDLTPPTTVIGLILGWMDARDMARACTILRFFFVKRFFFIVRKTY